MLELRGRVAQVPERVVRRKLDALERAAHVDRMRLMHHVEDGGVLDAGGSEHRLGLGLLVRRPHVRDGHYGQHHALGVAERQAVAGLQAVGDLLGDVEHDRHRPQRAVRQAHVATDAVVVGLPEEALKRGERARE